MFQELTPVKPKPNKDKGKEEEETSVKVLQCEINFDSESAMSLDSSLSQESETSNISNIERAFNNLQVNQDSQCLKVSRLTGKINPTSLTKNWYPKPTAPNVQYKERTQGQFSVSSPKLYDWNIDGLSKRNFYLLYLTDPFSPIENQRSAQDIDLKTGQIFEAVFGDSDGCFLRSRYTSSSPPLALAVYADTLNQF
ncbi:hypothetical protein L3X38_015373 [Prunus dulcis]|uniref:Uncharacterized protein n=1 Tax=Prunus dulcis TaxID=3755 RepID=A0AAD4WRM0_PRUDU|nr:hypothetical protein L3X38_015373 [Prunus dulcis]